MKKALIVLLMVALCASLFAGAGLANAKAFVKANYDKSSKTNPAPRTTADFEVFDHIVIKNVDYTIAWSTDTEFVKAVAGENHVVKIDIDEAAPAEIVYNLIAVITDPTDGATETLSMPKTLPQGQVNPSYEEITLNAYTLAVDEVTAKEVRLCGTVVAIPTVYSEQYKNITVNIQVGALSDNIIQCYRLSGEGCADLKVGDKITVEGKIKNYKGTIEFDKACQMVKPENISSVKTLFKAYELEDGKALEGARQVTGTIVSIPTAYSEQYGNITVNLVTDGLEAYQIQAYRLTGGADLAIGDTITVSGIIKNYKGTIEFDKNCTYTK